MMTRLEANRTIVNLIKETIAEYPVWRFQQIHQNIGLDKPGTAQWYEESTETLRNIKNGEKE